MTVSKLILIATWLACIGQAVYFHGRLPESLPAHFNAGGIAQSFASKNVVFAVYLGGGGLVMLMFLALGSRLGKVPERSINLPHKAYWLAPERRAETFATLARRLHWFGVATLALFFDMFQQIFKAVLGPARTLDHAPWSVGAYVAFAVIWVIALMARFRRPAG